MTVTKWGLEMLMSAVPTGISSTKPLPSESVRSRRLVLRTRISASAWGLPLARCVTMRLMEPVDSSLGGWVSAFLRRSVRTFSFTCIKV